MSQLIDPHLKWLKAGGRSEKTLENREQALWQAEEQLPYGLDEATTDDVADYLGNGTWSTWTRHTYETHLRRFYDWMYDTHERDDHPMWGLLRTPEGDRLPNPCTDEELAHLLEHAPRKWRLVFLLAAYAGLRAAEIGNLERDNITIERIRVERGKGGKDAYIDTHPIIWEAVRDLPAGKVVRDPDGSPVTGYQLTNRGWYLYRRLGMPDMHLHRLRHWHATSLLAAGADLETVRQCMRHASIVSTVGYTLIASKARREAVHRLPAVGHGPADNRPMPPTTEVA
jgi:integrase